MPMSDQRHVPAGQVWCGAVDDLATAYGHLFDALAGCRSGYDAVLEYRPLVTDSLANLVGGQAFITAVVPLHEVDVDLGIGQSGQLCGAARPLQGGGEGQRERSPFEELAAPCAHLFSSGRQR